MITQDDLERAKHNWVNWSVVFEHQGPAALNPLLVNAEVFKDFLTEYSVTRTIRSGRHDSLRKTLCAQNVNLAARLNDRSGSGVDVLDDQLRPEFGTSNPARRLRSVLSKIAAFVAPHSFVAWDRYARVGLNRTLRRADSYVPRTYADYLADVNSLLMGKIGGKVVSVCRDNYPTKYSAEQERFHRRVLDVYLMRSGGRWT
jgi:hypothetical protein